MKNIKVLLLVLGLAGSTAFAEELPELYVFKEMSCVFDGSLYGLPNLTIVTSLEHINIEVNGNAASITPRNFQLEVDTSQRPKVKGAKVDDVNCIEIHLVTRKPIGEARIYILNNRMWIFNSKVGWYDLNTRTQLSEAPIQVVSILKKVAAISERLSQEPSPAAPDPFKEKTL